MANLPPQFPTPLPAAHYPGFDPLRAPAFATPLPKVGYPAFNPLRAPAFPVPTPSFIWLTATQFPKPLPYFGYSGFIGSLPVPSGVTVHAPSFNVGAGRSGGAHTYVA
jgi:hypothetical protein